MPPQRGVWQIGQGDGSTSRVHTRWCSQLSPCSCVGPFRDLGGALGKNSATVRLTACSDSPRPVEAVRDALDGSRALSLSVRGSMIILSGGGERNWNYVSPCAPWWDLARIRSDVPSPGGLQGSSVSWIASNLLRHVEPLQMFKVTAPLDPRSERCRGQPKVIVEALRRDSSGSSDQAATRTRQDTQIPRDANPGS